MQRMGKREWDARVGACAAILRAEKAAKVIKIAQERAVSEDDAARMYVVGACKASVRRGTTRTIVDALERYEAEQVGDRAVSVHGEASINREVRRINRINDTQGGKGESHKRNMGKVLGTLYVEIEGAIQSSAIGIETLVSAAIDAYIRDYVTRLSKTARASIRDMVHSAYSVDAIMSAKTPQTTKMAKAAKYLHHNFPMADRVTTRELVYLLREHVS